MKNVVRNILLLVVVMTLTLTVVAFAAENDKVTFSIGEIVLEQGSGKTRVELPITLDKAISLNTLQVEVSFDESIEFTKFIAGDALAGVVEPAVGTNPVVIPFGSAEDVTAKAGTFATLEVEVPINVAKNFTITLEVAEAYSGMDDIISTVATVNGAIVINPNPNAVEVEETETDADADTNAEAETEVEEEADTVVDAEPEADAEVEKEMTAEKRGEDVICLQIDQSKAFAYGKMTEIDEANSKVVPYINNSRTMVPLRFVSETLGAEVLWETGWNYCYVNKDDKKIKITFGSADIEVNGEVVTYDAPVEMVEDRTMVPIRFISEELGYHVHWNEPNKAVVISPVDNPWVKDREAENSLLTSILVTFLMF